MDERRKVFELSQESGIFDFLVEAAQHFGTLETVVIERYTEEGFVHAAGYSVVSSVVKTENGYEQKLGTVPAKIISTSKINPATGY